MDREQQLEQLCKKLIFLIGKNRYWKKQWDEHYGAINRERVKHFEGVGDRLLDHLGKGKVLDKSPISINDEDLKLLKELYQDNEMSA